MSPSTCPELEQLFAELAEGGGPAVDHAHGCEACSALLEEHRELEKDLYRLADPLPPPDFVHRVMAQVAESPAPARTEFKIAAGILVSTLAVAAGLLIASDLTLAAFGVRMASGLVALGAFADSMFGALSVAWKAAALPVAGVLSALLMLSLVGLRRMLGVPALSPLKASP